MSWFDQLVGFPEAGGDDVRARLSAEPPFLIRRPDGARFRCGHLETLSLGELRERVREAGVPGGAGPPEVGEVVGDVGALHRDPESDGALFQVASQFNLLEMVGPAVRPEQGVGGYEFDHTQGPACAIACGAATIYRNYFAPVDGGPGQSAGRQIDCLRDLGVALGNGDGALWTMRNGYALATPEGLARVGGVLAGLGEGGRDALRSKLRVGVVWEAGVTTGGTNVVSQVFCSALPVAYSRLGASGWEPFARLVLEGAYEATLLAAALNRGRTGSPRCLLTLLGGGAFGNRMGWIVDAAERALRVAPAGGLQVDFVSYGSPVPEVRRLLGGGWG